MRLLCRVCRLSALTVLLVRCSGPAPNPPMAEDRLVELYIRAEALNRRYATSPDSLRAKRADLFRAQGTDQEEIERALAWYRQRPDRGLRVLEKIAKRLEGEDQKSEVRSQNERPSPSP